MMGKKGSSRSKPNSAGSSSMLIFSDTRGLTAIEKLGLGLKLGYGAGARIQSGGGVGDCFLDEGLQVRWWLRAKVVVLWA